MSQDPEQVIDAAELETEIDVLQTTLDATTVKTEEELEKKQTAYKDAKQPYVEIATDEEGQWHWLLWAGNGQPVALCAFSYATRHECLHSVRLAYEQFLTKPQVVLVHTN